MLSTPGMRGVRVPASVEAEEPPFLEPKADLDVLGRPFRARQA